MEEIDTLIRYFQPEKFSVGRRSEIIDFIDKVLRRDKLRGSRLLGSGSSSSRTYLPVSDVDLVLATEDAVQGEHSSMDHILAVFRALCLEVANADNNSRCTHSPAPFVIRKVEFVNARTKVVHCLVNNIGVDITINHPGSVVAAAFIEECDRLIGRDHLLKRSILLVKCWCIHESDRHAGQCIINSKAGFLSSYAICSLVLYLFNKFRALNHPLNVFRAFLYVFSEVVVWSSDVVTLDGIAKINGPTSLGDSGFNQFAALISQFQQAQLFSSFFSTSVDSGQSVHQLPFPSLSIPQTTTLAFPTRALNIQDPLDPRNNLGFSVARKNVAVFEASLRSGHAQLDATLLKLGYPRIETVLNDGGFCSVALKSGGAVGYPFVKQVFPQSYAEYMQSASIRRDLLDHPMQAAQHFHVTSLNVAAADPHHGAAAPSDQSTSSPSSTSSLSLSSSSSSLSVQPSLNGLEDPLVGNGFKELCALRDEWRLAREESRRRINGKGENQDAHTATSTPPASNCSEEKKADYFEEPKLTPRQVGIVEGGEFADVVGVEEGTSTRASPTSLTTQALVVSPLLPAITPSAGSSGSSGSSPTIPPCPSPSPSSSPLQLQLQLQLAPPLSSPSQRTIQGGCNGTNNTKSNANAKKDFPSQGPRERDEAETCPSDDEEPQRSVRMCLELEASPESERPAATRDASSSPFAELSSSKDMVVGVGASVTTADASAQTDELHVLLQSPSPAAIPVFAPSPQIPAAAAAAAASAAAPPPTGKQIKRKGAGGDAAAATTTAAAAAKFGAAAAMPALATASSPLLRGLLLVIGVCVAAMLVAAAMIMAVGTRAPVNSVDTQAKTTVQNQRGASPQPQSTLWIQPQTSVILAPSSWRFFDASTRRFVAPPIPANLPVAKEIGLVKQWRYEWRWEWELVRSEFWSAGEDAATAAAAAAAGCVRGELISSSSKSAFLVLRHREDAEFGRTIPVTATMGNAADETVEGRSFNFSCLSDDLPLIVDEKDASSAAPAPPALALGAWNGTEAALASMNTLSGIYTAFLRLYRIRHAGGVGAISPPIQLLNGASGRGLGPGQRDDANEHELAQDSAKPSTITLLQSIRLSSQSVEMAMPPRTKTKPGYFFKKTGERLELVVSAAGNPTPKFTWYKNGFPLQRTVQEREKPHLLVLDKLSKDDEGTYTCKLSNIAGEILGGEFTVACTGALP